MSKRINNNNQLGVNKVGTLAAQKDNDITRQVKHIKAQLERADETWIDDLSDDTLDGRTRDEIGAYDYLSDILDIEYVVTSKGEYLGARVLVAFGGPNIWINTRSKQVEGYWWNDRCILPYEDALGLDEVLEEFWGSTK